LQEALQLLKNRRVLSFPIVDTSTNSCIGVADILDICLFIVAKFPSIEVITQDVLISLEYEGRKFLQETTVSQVAAFSKAWNQSQLPYFPFKINTPLIDLINTFSVGIHRVPVVDDNDKMLNFISQMDLLRFLAENIYLLEERGIGNKTLDELGIGRGSVHFVRSDAMVIVAMAHMIKKKISAVPILDKDTGKLVATFSASDLRGIGPNDLHQLLRPITNFLMTFNIKSLYPLTCKLGDSLQHVILKLAGTKVHRLWVIDDSQNLQGVLSLSDVIIPFLGIEPMQSTPTIGSFSSYSTQGGVRIPIL